MKLFFLLLVLIATFVLPPFFAVAQEGTACQAQTASEKVCEGAVFWVVGKSTNGAPVIQRIKVTKDDMCTYSKLSGKDKSKELCQGKSSPGEECVATNDCKYGQEKIEKKDPNKWFSDKCCTVAVTCGCGPVLSVSGSMPK